jgi:ABC-2 type transport system ATP-binding protein
MIRTEKLGKRFGDTWAVRGLTIEVGRGEVFGFLGPNGAGKTTTVRLLASLIGPSEGRAWVEGAEVGVDAHRLRSRVGLLTESPGLYERLSSAENLDFHARLHGLPAARRRQRVRAALQQVGLWDRRDEPVVGFSRGMKQRLAIARAVLHEPAVIFLDEPTSGLDPAASRDVRDFIRDLRAEGRTVFLCTHNLDEARRVCDRVAIFRGQVLWLGTPRELERTVLRRRLGVRVANPSPTLVAAARALPSVRAAELADGQLVVELADADRDAPALVRRLVEAGADVERVAELDSLLEEAYLSIVERGGP